MTFTRRTSPFDELFSLRRAVDHLFDDPFARPDAQPERELVGAGTAS